MIIFGEKLVFNKILKGIQMIEYEKYHKYVMQGTAIVRVRALYELIEPIMQNKTLYTIYEQVAFESFKNSITCYLIALFGKGSNDKISLLKSDIKEVQEGAKIFTQAFKNDFKVFKDYRDKVSGHVDDDYYKKIKQPINPIFIEKCIKALNQMEWWIRKEFEKNNVDYKDVQNIF